MYFCGTCEVHASARPAGPPSLLRVCVQVCVARWCFFLVFVSRPPGASGRASDGALLFLFCLHSHVLRQNVVAGKVFRADGSGVLSQPHDTSGSCLLAGEGLRFVAGNGYGFKLNESGAS